MLQKKKKEQNKTPTTLQQNLEMFDGMSPLKRKKNFLFHFIYFTNLENAGDLTC